jgi:hypothetical protein
LKLPVLLKNNTEIIEVFDYFNFGAIIFKRNILRCTTTPKESFRYNG